MKHDSPVSFTLNFYNLAPHLQRKRGCVVDSKLYPTKIKFAVNGEVSFVYSKIPGGGTFQWPFDQPFYLIVDNQLEGWPGKVTKPEELPIDMAVDWVRLYQ